MLVVQRIINSVWTMDVDIAEESVTINSFGRDNREGYLQEYELPKLGIVEDEKRNITDILIDGKTYKVTNPQFIFSYE